MQAYKLDAFQVVADAKVTLGRLHGLLDGYKVHSARRLKAGKMNGWLNGTGSARSLYT